MVSQHTTPPRRLAGVLARRTRRADGPAPQEATPSTPPDTRGLDVRVSLAERGTHGLDVAFHVPRGRTLALLGTNGSGKSSTLATIAGLTAPDTGHVSVEEHTLVDTATRVWVPPHRRRVALLGQRPLLFPHLDVEANVAFAPRCRGASRRAARTAAARWLAAVDATHLASSRPHQLSGGQAARVALARALAALPDVLLLDEPFAALDVDAAPTMRRLLARVLRDTTTSTVVVTHDLLDALALADDVAVLDAGRIVEHGPTRTVLTSPRSEFAARFAGVDLLAGRYVGDGVLLSDAGVRIVGVPDDDVTPAAPAVAVFRPASVALHRHPPHGSPRNAWEGTVDDITDHGGTVRVRVRLGRPDGLGPVVAADITPAALVDLRLGPAVPVVVVVKAQEVGLHAGLGAHP